MGLHRHNCVILRTESNNNMHGGRWSDVIFEERIRKMAMRARSADCRGGSFKTFVRNPSQKKANKGAKGKDSSDPVNVFCRIRPLPVSLERCVERVDDRTIQLTAPSSSGRNAGNRDAQYTFEYVFDDQANQNEIFEDVGLPLVRDLVQGKNGLLFTYGITSSGKTFTIQGRPEQPGILPRSLDVLFNTLKKLQAPRCTFKPDGQNGFTIQPDLDSLLDRQRHDRQLERLFRHRPNKSKDIDGEFTSRVAEDAAVNQVDVDCVYSVFISYVEIYNNYAYDLLQPDDAEPGKGTVLQSRGLRDDANGRVYVAGVSEVEVQSADEALRLLCRGQKARRIASTQLNADSSRSHVIFNIRLVQAPLDETGLKAVQDNDIVRVSQLSLIDLAGSERTKRTKNQGDRLREAGNINASLLALRKCLDALRANQSGEQNYEMVPYRESKLTHLFKTFFEGDGKVRMIVCLNPAAEEYDETTHVLRFAESTQRIQVGRSQEVRFDKLGYTPGRRAFGEESLKRKVLKESVEVREETTTRVKHKSFLRDFEVLLTFPSIQLSHHTDSVTLPALARFLEDRIARHKALYESLKAQEVDFFNRLRDLLSKHDKTRRENVALRAHLEERDRRIVEMERELTEHIHVRNVLMHTSTLSEQGKIDLLGQLNDREYAIGQEQLKRNKYRSKLKGEAKDSAERREREFEKQLHETREQYSQKASEQEAQLRRIRDITINGSEGSEHTHSLTTPTTLTTPTLTTTASAPLSSTTSTLTATSSSTHNTHSSHPPYNTHPSHNTHSSHNIQPSIVVRNYSRSRQVAPTSHVMQTTQNTATPFVNPRYGIQSRRSKSHDQCLEHRSKHRVPVGTRLQPQYGLMERRKSVTKVEFEDAKKSQKYILEHQQADVEGNLQTSLFKGDIIPTAGGGRSVIFRDVETVVQQDPSSLVVERKRKVREEVQVEVREGGGGSGDGGGENGLGRMRQSAKKQITSKYSPEKRMYPLLPNRDN